MPDTNRPHAHREHALRLALNDELHARPHMRVATPSRVTHLVHLTGEEPADRAHIARLCDQAGLAPPDPADRQIVLAVEGRAVKWERHTEFTSVTVVEPGATDPVDWSALSPGLAAWVAAFPGERLVAVHLRLEPDATPHHTADSLARLFTGDVQGSRVNAGDALVWTDFRVGPDGFVRLLVRDVNLSPGRAGRLVQRLLEIETYRMTALLGLPLAREVAGQLSGLERRLGEIVSRIAADCTTAEEHVLLDQLTRLAAEAETLAARTRYRFGATRAYADLVEKRLSELREEHIPGLQRLGVFLDRRFVPAVRTCEAVGRRQAELTEGVGRASGLLRTRVDVHLAEQNADLLRAMAARTKTQLRIQEAVEGLSVFAISYYLLGLVKYMTEGLPKLGLPIGAKELMTGIAVPVVLAAVFLAVRRMRRALKEGDEH